MNDDKARDFSGVWWKTGSKNRLPWSGKRVQVRNETSRVHGDMEVDGSIQVNQIKAEGQLRAKGVASSTITNPKAQVHHRFSPLTPILCVETPNTYVLVNARGRC